MLGKLTISRNTKMARSRWYLVETITNTDYADDLTLLTYISALTKFLLYSLEQTAGGIGFHMKANKTDYISFK